MTNEFLSVELAGDKLNLLNMLHIIKKMLHEEGMDGKFDNVLSQQEFFPESLFYHLLGNPENIFLYNELLEAELT